MKDQISSFPRAHGARYLIAVPLLAAHLLGHTQAPVQIPAHIETQLVKPAAPVEKTPARTVLVRNQEATAQNLVMGPEATILWKKIQTLIANPDIKDFARLVALFDLKVTLPMDEVDWRKPGLARRNDIKGAGGMIKSGRYGIGVSSGPYPRRRFLTLDIEFDLAEFCLSKQEIQRLYMTGWEVAPVHSPQFPWQDKTGTAHGFPLAGGGGGFDVAASGCATRYSKSEILEVIYEDQGK